MKLFTYLVGISALFVAGCAAFFSVRGIGLLFAGSMLSVVIMASSLELAKLVGASFLYRAWKDITFLMRAYMTFGVVVLVCITSMGIYGYLSDAFEDTKSRVYVYESNIQQLEKENIYLEEEIVKISSSADLVDGKAQQSEESFKKIYDEFVVRQEARRDRSMERLSTLDAEVAVIEAQPGGLFSSKKKRLIELKTKQEEERNDIRMQLKVIDEETSQEYKTFLAKIDNLRQTTQEVDVQPQIKLLYAQIKNNNQAVLGVKQDIQNTDIGSFKFIARTFGTDLEQAVKWFIIIIVVVFDPMAVSLVLAYNVLLLRVQPNDKNKRIKNAKKEKEKSTTEIISNRSEEEAEHTKKFSIPETLDDPQVMGKVDAKDDVDKQNKINKLKSPEYRGLSAGDARKLKKAIPALRKFKGSMQQLVEAIWQKRKKHQ